MNPESSPRIAAVVQPGHKGVDDLISGFALSLINRGCKVRGLVQEASNTEHGCSYRLVDLDDGTSYIISQDLGSESTACCLDPAAIAEASKVMRRINENNTDLAIFNRFGKLESFGSGLSAEMLDLMTRNIPVLTVVTEPYLDAWRHFTGGMAVELPPRLSALEAWFEQRS